jgi:TfoX/Sxy family transcriptional regulator of competence genes
MAYNEKLAERIRERLGDVPKVEEKKMMGGLAFMVNKKMCVGVFKDELMCRIDPTTREELVERQGCRVMAFTGRPMKGIVLVDDSGLRSPKDFEFWMKTSLDYNTIVTPYKKKKKKTS